MAVIVWVRNISITRNEWIAIIALFVCFDLLLLFLSCYYYDEKNEDTKYFIQFKSYLK